MFRSLIRRRVSHLLLDGGQPGSPNVVQPKTRHVTPVCSSRAPLEKLIGHRERMGWTFKWVSAVGSDFDRDLGFLHTGEG